MNTKVNATPKTKIRTLAETELDATSGGIWPVVATAVIAYVAAAYMVGKDLAAADRNVCAV